MTFWATLWYSGMVVLQISFPGQTQEQCAEIINVMIQDIDSSFANPALESVLDESMFPVNLFSVSCETQKLETHPQYLKEE